MFKVFQYSHKAIRPVFQVKLTSDNRYIPTEGKYSEDTGHAPVDTTYTVPQIAYHKINIATHPVEPDHKEFHLPNHLLKGHPKIQAIAAQRNHNNNNYGKPCHYVHSYKLKTNLIKSSFSSIIAVRTNTTFTSSIVSTT